MLAKLGVNHGFIYMWNSPFKHAHLFTLLFIGHCPIENSTTAEQGQFKHIQQHKVAFWSGVMGGHYGLVAFLLGMGRYQKCVHREVANVKPYRLRDSAF